MYVRDRHNVRQERDMQSHIVVKMGHLPHWEVTADIRIEDKESPGVATQDLVTKVVDTTSCPQRSILLKIPTHVQWF